MKILQPLHKDRLPHKANWQVFGTICKLKLLKDPNIIDQTTSASNKHNTPWFDNDCRIAIRLCKAALWKFNKEPTTINLNAFKLLRAKTSKIIKEAKKKSWWNYVNQLGSSTRTNTIWMMWRKISRKTQSTALQHLTKKKMEATTKT